VVGLEISGGLSACAFSCTRTRTSPEQTDAPQPRPLWTRASPVSLPRGVRVISQAVLGAPQSLQFWPRAALRCGPDLRRTASTYPHRPAQPIGKAEAVLSWNGIRWKFLKVWFSCVFLCRRAPAWWRCQRSVPETAWADLDKTRELADPRSRFTSRENKLNIPASPIPATPQRPCHRCCHPAASAISPPAVVVFNREKL
jgi:hypothetical protein